MSETGAWYPAMPFADVIAREAAGSAPIEQGAERASAVRVLGEDAQTNGVENVVAAFDCEALVFLCFMPD